MNDVHYANEPLMHRAFFYTARENGWMIGDTSPDAFWYCCALDYAVKEVRDEQLAYMAEITENYDAFGIELDFSRTIRCFKELGHHNIPIMTDFLRQVRALCDRAAEKWGHPVRIMIRLSTRGADAVYLYNLFGVPAAWRIASSPEEALKVPVHRYLTTMNNFRPKGYKEREAVYLPVTCSVATAAEVTFSTGTLDTKKNTLLCLQCH